MPRSLFGRLRGHFLTLCPPLMARLGFAGCPAVAGTELPWSTTLIDPQVGPVRLSGAWRDQPGADEIVVLVHGLGGGPDSYYCRAAAATLTARGVATLNLALRGADLSGEDFYNVGQTADLHAAIASPQLARYRSIYVLGFSMGGHATLHLAADAADPRVRAVAAVCSPVHLASIQQFIDAPGRSFYRNHVLDGLKAVYAAVARRRPVPTPAELVRGARSIFQWDQLAIAPRYGFEGAEHSYAELSVAPRLRDLRRPALLVAAEEDPMVAVELIRQHVPGRCEGLELHYAPRAGHLAFHRRLDLGLGRDLGLLGQVLGWMRARA